jgi:hypothetical protein
MEYNNNNNFTALLSTIAFLMTEYFITFKELFSETIRLFFFVIDSQVSMYFKIFNNLFIASLDTVRYLVDGHFKLINKLMVKNKTENIVVLALTVIILHWNYHYYLHHPCYQHHYQFHYHYGLLNQSHSIPPWQNSRYSYLPHQPLLH